ncbi:putative tyrosinase-like protein tyr-3 [Bulinus truncatus]|nr:putative tyrosinase-like protein tyr-3 [Bulinus truncatus]
MILYLEHVYTQGAKGAANDSTSRRTKRQTTFTFSPCVRKEYRMLTLDERRRYHNAINALKRNAQTPLEPNIYTFLSNLHSDRESIDIANGGAGFLGWHRIFLRIYEALLKTVDPSVCLPYWDSTLDRQLPNPLLSSIWSPDFLGTSEGAVVEGPFANWRLANGGQLMRNVGSDGDLLSPDVVNDILSRNSYDEIITSSRRNAQFNIEQQHGAVHNYVAGTMTAIDTSANDPVFFLHHAFIDYIFERFRQRLRSRGINPATYPRAISNPRHAPTAPTRLGRYNQGDGYSDFFARGVTYEPVPTCSTTSRACGSRFLVCQLSSGMCIPTARSNTRSSARTGRSIPDSNSTQTCQVPPARTYDLPYQNDFCSRDNCDTSQWVTIPVKIVSVRPPKFDKYNCFPVKNGEVDYKNDVYSPRAYQQTTKRVAGIPGYVTAQLEVYNVTQKMEFIVGDNQTYGDFLNLVLENNTYYMIHYVALSTLNQVTTYSSSSLSAPVKTVPFDPFTSPPIQIDVTNKSTECISLNWTASEEIENIITGFTVRLEESGSTNTVPTVDELNNTTRSIRKCNLKSYTLYTATVSAKSANGIFISSNTFRTVHDPPPRPADPIFVNSSYTTITVTLEPVVLTAGPLTAYRLYVEKVSAPSKRRRRSHTIESNTHLDVGLNLEIKQKHFRHKRSTDPPGYITAELSKSDIIRKINFTVGDTKMYGNYTNIPQAEKSWYIIHYAVFSISDSNYSSLNPPRYTVPYVMPLAPTAVQSSESNGILIGVIVGFIILLLIILLLVALYVCWWRKNRFNPYEYHEDETSSMELPTYKDDYDPSKYWSAINNIKESRHIIAGRELVYENNMKPHNQLNSGMNLNAPIMSFKDEYQDLPHKSKRATDNAARSYRNFNRFPHLLP